MKNMFRVVLVCLLGCSVGQAAGLDTARIEQLTGLKGALNEKENVFKVSYPRADIKASVNGVNLTPGMGLTAWAAFTTEGSHTMVMGDIVMLEPQVNKVMDVALSNGLDVTALHNHFFYDTPKVMFMHVGGMGDQDQLARAIGVVMAALKEQTTDLVPQKTTIDPATSSLNPKALDEILKTTGQFKDGVYKATFGKSTKMGGHEMGNAMGVNTWAAFAGSDDQAVVDGDFAVYENELQGVLKALRKEKIDIVAIHNHMTGETPRVIFLHYWGIGRATELADGVHRALQTQAK